MPVGQPYPFDVQKFPDDDDLLLDDEDLKRKNIIYCRKEILEQMKCTQFAKDEYIAEGLDPENKFQWMHYHMKHCFTPYQDGIGCMINIQDREIQSLKQQAGPEGWELIRKKFIQDASKKVGEIKAKKAWEYQTNLKSIHETERRKNGYLYGEKTTNNDGNTQQDYYEKQASHEKVERMFAAAAMRQLEKEKQQAQQRSKSWFGFW